MSNQDPFQPPPTRWDQPPVADPFGSPAPYAPQVPTYAAAPAYGAPAYGAPAYGAPVYGAPAYGYPGAAFGFGVPVRYASWIQRVGAYLLDSLAILPYVAGLLFMTVTSETSVNQYGSPIDQPTSAGAIAFGVGALVSLVLWAWNRWVRGGRTGQSWGKQAVGLTMQRDATGEPIGVWMAFVRDIAHYVDGILYLGYLWPLWDTKRQTFSDKLTKTVVVS